MKQRQLEENLQKREQELDAREIELLGRELNMMMTQSTPTPIKRRGKFKKARLKVLPATPATPLSEQQFIVDHFFSSSFYFHSIRFAQCNVAAET